MKQRNTTGLRIEQRRSERRPRCEALLWRRVAQEGEETRDAIAWLLECSETGFAFAHRGAPAPEGG